MDATTVRLLAAAMAATHLLAWVLWSRWERPGRDAQLRAAIRPAAPVGWASDLLQVTPLVYPLLVVVAPRFGYDTWLNWSSGLDGILLSLGVGLWAAGVAGVTWAARTLGRYVAVEGLTVDHELVTRGPYARVRHPVYTASTAVAVGVALIFRSYLLLAVAVGWATAAWWWAKAEEELLASADGFGAAYRAYAASTGRFLPRWRRPVDDDPAPQEG